MKPRRTMTVLSLIALAALFADLERHWRTTPEYRARQATSTVMLVGWTTEAVPVLTPIRIGWGVWPRIVIKWARGWSGSWESRTEVVR